MKLNCIVIEDEPIARKGMEDFILRTDYLNFVAGFRNPLQALETLQTERADIMFLDIKMPEISGISFLRTLVNPPATIITTAYSNYAVESFELNVKDYLLKPISFERFLTAVNKIRASAMSKDDFIFIKCDTRIEKIFVRDIFFIKALENYVVIQTDAKKYICHVTLKSVAEFLPEDMFVKIHKSYIIAIPKISSIEGNTIRIGSYEIAFNRNNKEEIMNSILRNNYLKR